MINVIVFDRDMQICKFVFCKIFIEREYLFTINCENIGPMTLPRLYNL